MRTDTAITLTQIPPGKCCRLCGRMFVLARRRRFTGSRGRHSKQLVFTEPSKVVVTVLIKDWDPAVEQAA